MHDRPHQRIVVEGGNAEHDMRLAGALSHNVAAAHRAEPPHFTGRGFEGRKFVAAREQMKMIPRDARRGRVGSRMTS